MRKIILAILIAFTWQVSAQEKALIEKPIVDERIELIGIVFRLAGNSEYNHDFMELYANRIDAHFAPYKNHELILFAKILRNEKGISYDAPMSLAISLDDNLNPLTEIDLARWDKEDALAFLRLLKSFYVDARCEVFFNQNKELYQKIIDSFSSVYQDFDLNWYSTFYGNEPAEKFKIVIAPVNGGNCYGPSFIDANERKEVYAIMGVWDLDSVGIPVFAIDDYLPIIIHEFNHSFVNPLLEKNEPLFKNGGEKIYEAMQYEMSVQQAYGNWETVLNEALVRASVIKYYKDHKAEQSVIDNLVQMEMNNGFIWIKELIKELDNYEKDRNEYPNLEAYMPQLAKAYHVYAEQVEKFDMQRPRVTSIDEFENGNVNVSTAIKTITIHFDKALAGMGYSVFYGEKGKEAFPKHNNIQYINDNKAIQLEVELEADKEYQFVLTGKNFKTPDGYALKTYDVNFKTEK